MEDLIKTAKKMSQKAMIQINYFTFIIWNSQLSEESIFYYFSLNITNFTINDYTF